MKKPESPAETYRITELKPKSPMSEAYRSLRTNLRFVLNGSPTSRILITSPTASDGKSVTAANLAIAIAQTGDRVLLVDADMRRPMQHQAFAARSATGLSHVLAGQASPEEVEQQTSVPNLSLVVAGPVPPNPSELLGGERMKTFLDDARGRFSLVVVDSPPVLVVADASVLAPLVDGTILVLRSGQTRIDAARAASEQITRTGGKILGAVVNDVTSRAGGYHYYSYYGGQGAGE